MEIENKEVAKKDEYGSYYIFVAVSAVIGFIFLYWATKSIMTIDFIKGISAFSSWKAIWTVLVALCGTALFIFISLVFKSFLKPIYFSEMFMYLYMGFLATAVNLIAFNYFLNIFAKHSDISSYGWKIAEIIAFIVAIIFAFFTNKIFVFRSFSFKLTKLATEFLQFTIGRLVTEGINIAIMYVMIDVKHMSEMITKLIASIIVIVLNYVFSKFIIFKKTETKD